MAVDKSFEEEWKAALTLFEKKFGEDMDMQAILFLIGVQELGKGPQKFAKDEKVGLIHIAICTLLAPFGYYELEGHDDDGWPHYKNIKKLPALQSGEQLKLMKVAVMDYMDNHKEFFQ